MIVASRFGWPAVSDLPMDHEEFLLAVRLIAEEDIGKPVREHHRSEDREFRKSLHNARQR